MFCSFERYVVCFVSLLSSCSFGFVSVLYLSWFSVLFMFCVLFCWRMGGFCFVLFYVFFSCLFVRFMFSVFVFGYSVLVSGSLVFGFLVSYLFVSCLLVS